MLEGGREREKRAVVTYQAPHGEDGRTLYDSDVIAFGRGEKCKVRFAYAPEPEDEIPRVAGFLIVANSRVIIESAVEVGRRAIEVRTAGGAPKQIAWKEAYSPRESQFDVVIRGSGAPWTLSVTSRPVVAGIDGTGATDLPTSLPIPRLTEGQRIIFDAYYEPIRNGRIEPATHGEVAARIGKTPGYARKVLYEVWALLFSVGIPMQDVLDKRIAVVEAARIHGLLSTEP